MKREVFGFDVRYGPVDYRTHDWPEEARKQFLLNPGIRYVLAVDTMAWPSYFISKSVASFYDEEILERHIVLDASADFRHDCLYLWQNLEEMKECFERLIKDREGIVIGVELIAEKPLLEYDYWQNIFYPDAHSLLKMPEDFHFLGYDVADGGYISGLSNCGYTEDEIRELGPVWKDRLNEFGLIGDLDHALEFKEMTEERVAEHAPFYVFGLYSERDLHPYIIV
jgi:hypothetical protein